MNVIISNYKGGNYTFNETDLQLKEIFNDCSEEKDRKLIETFFDNLCYRKISFKQLTKIKEEIL